MKSIIIIFLLMLSFSLLYAQQNNFGIYNSWEDYRAGRLSLEGNCNSSSDKIKLHHFFCKDYVEVIKDGKSFRFSKDSVFGYRDCEQNNYRFYKECDKEYQIIEKKDIVIYVADAATASSNGKTILLVHHYFFSTSLSSAILPLTILNLKRAFPDNLKFHDLLDLAFGDGTSVSSYDEEHKMYKANYLLSQSK